ncbi:hypothetical protein Tco_0245265 [Tanacetum coccineum]
MWQGPTLLGLMGKVGMLGKHLSATGMPPIANQKPVVTCFGYCAQGHFKSECPKSKNQNHGNQKGKKRKDSKDPNVIIDNANAYGEIFPALHSET